MILFFRAAKERVNNKHIVVKPPDKSSGGYNFYFFWTESFC